MTITKELKEIQEIINDVWIRLDKILNYPESKNLLSAWDETPIEKLDLSKRAINSLGRNNIEFVEQMPKTKSELLRLRKIGHRTANEILDKIKALI